MGRKCSKDAQLCGLETSQQGNIHTQSTCTVHMDIHLHVDVQCWTYYNVYIYMLCTCVCIHYVQVPCVCSSCTCTSCTCNYTSFGFFFLSRRVPTRSSGFNSSYTHTSAHIHVYTSLKTTHAHMYPVHVQIKSLPVTPKKKYYKVHCTCIHVH